MDQRAITPLSGSREADDPALATGKTDRMQRLHRRLLGWLYQEMIRQHGSRSMAAKCERYYDGHQLTDEQIADAKEAGLQAIVYNEVAPTVDWLIGTELRTRVDQFVTAEDEGEEAERDAEAKSKVMKYLSAVNREPFEFSAGVQDQLKAGIGWVEVGVSNDQDGALIYVGHVPWRSVLWDSIDCRADLADCRYAFRVKVVDSDVALGIFKSKAQQGAIQRAITSGDPTEMLRGLAGDDVPLEGADSLRADMMVDEGYDVSSGVSVDLYNTRERVMLIECWYRDYSRSDQLDPGEMGEMSASKIRVAIFTEADMLLDEPSPFRHGRLPFVPIWGYRSAGTRLPYSPIRRMIGPQDAYNVRVLAALRAALDRRIIAEKGAFDPKAMSIEEVSREMAAVDGVAVVADGAVSGGKIREVANTQQAAALAQAADRDLMHLRTASGITSENRGLDSNASSGKAILAKADQGSILTAQLIENQSFARQLIGELKLSLIEQYMTQPRTVRVPGEGGQVERMRINTGGRTLDQMRAHFSIGEQAWKQSFAEAAFESLMQVMGQLAGPAPQVVINILDLIFEIHPHLPRKTAIVNRIRDINGQTSPDGRASPEQIAKQQQAAKVAEAKFRAEMAKLDADVAEAQARGEKLGAESVRTRLTAIYEAAQAAQVAIQVPGAMPVADQLLASAGFKDLDGSGTAAVVPEQAVQQVQQAQPAAMPQMAELQQADGVGAGIETAAADGVRAPQQQF